MGFHVSLTYAGPAGTLTVAKLVDPALVERFMELAIGSAEARAAAFAQTDLVWAEMEKAEAIRLRLVLDAIRGKAAATPDESTTGVQ